MNMSDPISDMLTRIRNAGKAGHAVATIPGSKLKAEIARVLKEQGFVTDFETVTDGPKVTLKLGLKYFNGNKSVIEGLRRISKPSRRVYVGVDDIPRVRGGLGVAIISTPRGIMTDREARKQHVGGEVLCYVW